MQTDMKERKSIFSGGSREFYDFKIVGRGEKERCWK